MVYRVLAAATIASLALTAMPRAVAQTTVAASYWKRLCGMPAQLAQTAPITAGTLLLQRGTGAAIPVRLGASPVSVTVPGSGPLTAKLLLETPRVSVGDGASASAIVIDLRPAVPDPVTGAETFAMYLKEDERNGSINALLVLEGAAELAEQANGAPLPQLTALVFDNAGSAPAVTHFDSPTNMNVVGAVGRDDRWEPTVLLHEYGHFLMEQVAPGGPSGDEHFTEKSYPAMPDLAWTEGFGWAFAAVVTQSQPSGVLLYRCGPYMSFAETPVRPRLTAEDARYAQYNETRVGAAAYHLVGYLGGGVPGFKRLLDGMKQYRRDGHHAHTARDLRDLAVKSFETTAADHAAIDTVFAVQGMSWEQGFHFGIAGSEDHGTFNDSEIALRITGPGGFDCRPTADVDPSSTIQTLDHGDIAFGEKGAMGPLGYSDNDDCYVVSGDGVAGNSTKSHTFGTDAIEIPFPYLDLAAHWAGPYTVSAKYVCERAQYQRRWRCPETFTLQLTFTNPWLIQNAPSLRRPIPVTLVKGMEMPVATFKANGECRAQGVDCGF